MGFFKAFERNKKILENISYLSILQIVNMVLPLFVFPYLIKILGSEIYGLVIFCQAIIGYFVIIINFGFNITATKEISINRNNKKKIEKILSSVLIIKIGLLMVSLLILSLLIIIVPEFHQFRVLLYLTFWMCVYEVIFPVYFFQGFEEMGYITLITLFTRTIFVVFIFLFVKSSDDYLLIPLINGIGALIAGIVSQFIILKKGFKYFWQPFYVLKFYFFKSFVMALAYASNSLKSNLNIVIVKILFSFKEVAYFDLALKISQIGSSFLELISVSVFPKMSREKNLYFLRKIIYGCSVLSLIFVIIIQLLAPSLVVLLGGNNMDESIYVLRVVVFFVPFYIIGGLLGRNGLIVNGYNRDVLISMVISSFVYVFITFLLCLFMDKLSIILLGIIFVFSFIVDFIYRFIKCRQYKII